MKLQALHKRSPSCWQLTSEDNTTQYKRVSAECTWRASLYFLLRTFSGRHATFVTVRPGMLYALNVRYNHISKVVNSGLKMWSKTRGNAVRIVAATPAVRCTQRMVCSSLVKLAPALLWTLLTVKAVSLLSELSEGPAVRSSAAMELWVPILVFLKLRGTLGPTTNFWSCELHLQSDPN
jgi:hypothetical protein